MIVRILSGIKGFFKVTLDLFIIHQVVVIVFQPTDHPRRSKSAKDGSEERVIVVSKAHPIPEMSAHPLDLITILLHQVKKALKIFQPIIYKNE